MTKILPIIIGAFFWAWMTEQTTIGKYGIKRQHSQNRFFFFMLVLTLALPITLRRSYNDTGAYINGFLNAPTLVELLSEGSLHLLRNPLFRIYEALIRTITDNYMIYFMFPAFFVQYSYVRFIRKHSPSLLIGIMLYVLLGTYTFSIAAMKQTVAMAILLYAVDALIERKQTRFYGLVFLAFLFHTYAIAFLILPLFTTKPWTPRTFLLLFAVLFVIGNFESVIGSFLEFANESGKKVAEEEVLGTAGINPIRVAVYAVTPLFALAFHKRLFRGREDRERYTLINMSILTVAIMSIGLVNAANMFARMAQYFEFGLICSLPWMIRKTFNRKSAQMVMTLAICCFAAYFVYANAFWMPFDDNFSQYTVAEFIERLFRDLIF